MEEAEEEIIVINFSCRKGGYNAECKLLPGLYIAYKGNFSSFKKYVQESMDFYIDCAKKDGDDLYYIFKENMPYKLEFRKYPKLH